MDKNTENEHVVCAQAKQMKIGLIIGNMTKTNEKRQICSDHRIRRGSVAVKFCDKESSESRINHQKNVKTHGWQNGFWGSTMDLTPIVRGSMPFKKIYYLVRRCKSRPRH